MRVVVILFGVLVVAATGLSAFLLLNACGLRLPLGLMVSACPTPQQLETRGALDAADREGRDLALRITYLERELAALQCEAEPPPPAPPPEPEPEPEPETDSGLPPDAFEQGNISVMEGCWQLDSNYSVTHIRTKEVTHFRYWQICFDAQGEGREVMRSTNGVVCQGKLGGRLTTGKLIMTEPGNLSCSNSTYIFRREITCALDAQGRAHCETYQPEIDGRGKATLRREGR